MKQPHFGSAVATLVLVLFAACVQPAESPDPTPPVVALLTTGGTIAGAASTRSAIGYDSARLDTRDLLAAVPGLEAVARIESERIASIGSQNMTDTVWFALARRCRALMERKDVAGIVITHGTDTIEETAFFLDLVLPPGKPVVLVGAMRPATALGADGPANLYQAVKVAAAPTAVRRGVMIVMNGTILGARDARKANTAALDALRPANFGPLGYVNAAGAIFSGLPRTAQGPVLSLPAEPPLPRVEIVYAHAQMDAAPIEDAVRRGARGIVLAGVGSGNAADAAMAALRKAVSAGIVVVRASRVGSGSVERNVEVDDDTHGFTTSLHHSPQKARILVQLLLANGIASPAAVQEALDAHDH